MSTHTPIFDLKRGAEWVRADFHLHTIKETGPSRKAYRDEFADRENDFNSEFVKRLLAENIRVGAITNHNIFNLEEYLGLAKTARHKGILLLPGIELGVQGGDSSIHTLVIFDPQSLNRENNFIEKFLHAQFPRGNPGEGDATNDNLAGCLQKLEAIGVDYFIVFAHVNSDNGLTRMVKKTALNPIYEQVKTIWDNRVLGFQISAFRQNLEDYNKRLTQILPDNMPIPAFVAGSDPEKGIAEVAKTERGVCHLKVSDLTFHSVQFALKDHALRVCGEKPVEKQRPVIESMTVTGGKLNKPPEDSTTWHFSTELNTLIGSRGSGKSLMIEILRWGLGLESGEGDATYKNGLIHAFLNGGAIVKIEGKTEQGESVTVTRAYVGKNNPPSKILLGTNAFDVGIETVFPGLLYFGQKDLGSRQENFYGQFFEQILGSCPDVLQNNEQFARQAFETSIDNYLAATKAKSDDDEYRFEQENLKRQLDVFKERGVEQNLREITLFDQDVRRFERFRKAYAEKIDILGKSAEEWGNAFPEDDVFMSTSNASFKIKWSELKIQHKKSATALGDGIMSINVICDALEALHVELDTRRQELQENFAAILRDLNVPDLDIDAYRKMVTRHEQLAEYRKLTAERSGKLAHFEQAMITAGELWHSKKQAITSYYEEQIKSVNDRLPKNIRIAIQFQGDKADFRLFLEGLFRGSRFDEISYGVLLNTCDSGLALWKGYKSIVENKLSSRMGEILQEKLWAHFKKMLVFSPKDTRKIHYDDVSIDELSLGKRAMALLLLLLSLEHHSIIILDQPEDDLDNETIHRLVVEPLIHRKNDIQFIIATHNPNLPVLGDSEQVFACRETSNGSYKRETGSLDMKDIKQAIINIMEGGKTAFDKRHNIYTLWKKSN